MNTKISKNIGHDPLLASLLQISRQMYHNMYMDRWIRNRKFRLKYYSVTKAGEYPAVKEGNYTSKEYP